MPFHSKLMTKKEILDYEESVNTFFSIFDKRYLQTLIQEAIQQYQTLFLRMKEHVNKLKPFLEEQGCKKKNGTLLYFQLGLQTRLLQSALPVSYTHLDVYKRQSMSFVCLKLGLFDML